MTRPRIPAGACDCHMHVFGDNAAYPPAPVRGYTPRPASFAEYRAMARAIGLERVVLVQPSAYGTDNRCMTDTLGAGDPDVRAVAVIDDAIADAELDAFHAIGVRGVRLNLVSSAVPAPGEAREMFLRTAAKVARLDWHVQIFAQPALIETLLPLFAESPVPVVIDHMGAVDASLGPAQPSVQALVGLLQAGRHWVKLAGANRISKQPHGFRDALPVMNALIAVNPDRLVWGTDWPHIGPHAPGHTDDVTYMPHDNAALLDLLAEACDGDAAILRRIVSENPGRLYGFSD